MSELKRRTKPQRIVVLVNDEFEVVARPPATALAERVMAGDRLHGTIERAARSVAGASETMLVSDGLAMTVTRLAGSKDPRMAVVFQEVYVRSDDLVENS